MFLTSLIGGSVRLCFTFFFSTSEKFGKMGFLQEAYWMSLAGNFGQRIGGSVKFRENKMN